MNTVLIVLGFIIGPGSLALAANLSFRKYLTSFLLLLGLSGIVIIVFAINRETAEKHAFRDHCQTLLNEESVIQFLSEDCSVK